jgi:hypothetical protein
MPEGTFVTAINCLDGRTQEPVNRWLRFEFIADYVDTITEPGPDGLLAEGAAEAVESIKRRVLISVEKHGSRVIAVVAHHDCAGNPVSKAAHLDQLRRSIALIQSWHLPAEVVGLWVDDRWQVRTLADASEGG